MAPVEMLSLSEPAEAPAPVINRSTAVLISIGIHLLAVLLFVVAPARMPESVRVALRAWFAPLLPAAPSPVPPPAAVVSPPPAKQDSIPLKFAYVKVPEDAEQRRNPAARLLSDRDRRARQEMPTPAAEAARSADPHSEGTSPDRVRPDPRLAEGQDSPDLQAMAAGASTPAADRPATETAGSTANVPEPTAPHEATSSRSPVPVAAVEDGEGAAAPQAPADRPADPAAASGESSQPAGPARGGLPDVRGGEYEFQFSNPGWLREPNYGTMSFDTQGFPWGDYARRIYVIIRNRWLDRIPLAAREGIRGWVCWHFVIGRDGTVSGLTLRRASGVPPFDRAASDALNAASPLPALPPDFPNPEEGVTFCFYYNLYPGEDD